jgi:hypothetical protein
MIQYLLRFLRLLSILSSVIFATSPGASALAEIDSDLSGALSLPQLTARLEELKKLGTNIGGNDFLIDREYDRLDTEIERYNQILGAIDKTKSSKEDLDKLKSEIISLSTSIRDGDCKSVVQFNKNRATLTSDVQRFQNELFRSQIGVGGAGDLEVLEPQDKPYVLQAMQNSETTDGSDCQTIQNELKENKSIEELSTWINKIESAIQDNKTKAVSNKDIISQILELAKKRQKAIQERLTNTQQSTAKTISNQLWQIISVIGVSGILTMLSVKAFGEDIQMEWVASGQVIQFVTVLILLSVILSLGLSNILNENTLGTLLGGIAGYVLAQGVGRAAARAALATPPKAPPPPPPPPPNGLTGA